MLSCFRPDTAGDGLLHFQRSDVENHLTLFVCHRILLFTMNSDAVLLLETVHFAAEKHRNQRRKDTEGTPYINHPIGRYFVVMPSGAARTLITPSVGTLL